jgi:hypothetical protein
MKLAARAGSKRFVIGILSIRVGGSGRTKVRGDHATRSYNPDVITDAETKNLTTDRNEPNSLYLALARLIIQKTLLDLTSTYGAPSNHVSTTLTTRRIRNMKKKTRKSEKGNTSRD